MSRRRDVALVRVAQAQHAGLWLDKYLSDESNGPNSDNKPKAILVSEVAGIPEPLLYEAFFARWKTALTDAGVTEAGMVEARVQGRMAVGLGSESVLETSITLHRTYGVPVIPGSALKGLASSYAHRRLEGDGWRKKTKQTTVGDDHKIMFGTTESAGYVTFYDALYVPGSGFRNGATPQALWPDVITVHHPKYYMEEKPPADWDSPTPVSFLSATGCYLIAVGGPEEWVSAALRILELALAEEGIGAKTSSGYGRMAFDSTCEEIHTPTEPYVVAKKRLLKVESPPPGRSRGTVADIKRNGDFGFINPSAGGGQVFIHHSDILPTGTQLRVGQVLEYRLGRSKGREQAYEVVVLLEPDPT